MAQTAVRLTDRTALFAGVSRIEGELADAWGALVSASDRGVESPAFAKALVRFKEASVAVSPEHADKLATAASDYFAGATRSPQAVGGGYEGISDFAKLLGERVVLRRLILGAVAGSILLSAAPASALGTPGEARPGPAPIVAERVVEDAAHAELAAKARPGLPSGKADLFPRVMEFTSKWEGGKVDHKDDRGGRTNLGITQAKYDAWRAEKGLEDKKDVWEIAPEEALEIYKRDYWAAIRGDELPERVALAVFDMAVHSGPGRAIKTLQTALGVTADGRLGPQTLNALYDKDPHKLFDDFNDARQGFFDGIVERDATQDVFMKGWKNRINDLRRVGIGGTFESLFESVFQTWRALVRGAPVSTSPMGKALED